MLKLSDFRAHIMIIKSGIIVSEAVTFFIRVELADDFESKYVLFFCQANVRVWPQLNQVPDQRICALF